MKLPPQKGRRKYYKTTKSKRPVGPPTKAEAPLGHLCTPDMCEKAYQKAKSGIPLYVIFPLLGISKNTFERWRTDHPEFGEAVLKGKAEYTESIMGDYNDLGKLSQVKDIPFPETRRKVIEYMLARTWPSHISDVTIEVKNDKSPAQQAWEDMMAEKKKEKNEDGK